MGDILIEQISGGTDEVTRERVARLFQFVAALYERRNPAIRQLSDHEWILRLADVPEHETIDLVTSLGEEPESNESAEAEPRPLLRCARPIRTAAPKPPEILANWLGREWEDCSLTPLPIENINRTVGGETQLERFEADATRVEALESYRSIWNLWAENEKSARAAGEIFERLYSLYGKLQRDGERVELVISDGIIAWARSGGGVSHPLLMRPVRLEFDPQIPEFRVMDSGEATDFYSSLFRSMPDVDGRIIGKFVEEATELNLHPLGGSDVVGFLKSVVTRLSSKGTYVETGPPGPERENPVVGRRAAFLLRKRTAGFARAIDAVIADLSMGGEIPRALCNVVGIAPNNGEVPQAASAGASPMAETLSDDEILFTKEANKEQLDIARALEREDCVLVQGPPGTGKTHTIANLLGHLLSQGKSVLVLSHTTKALKVLREKVVTQLQPLCVSVLDSKEDDAALKSSIEGIIERIGNADPARLEREIKRLQAERVALVDDVRLLATAVLNARLDEQREIVLDGNGVRPIDAAKEVAAGTGLNDWIPGNLTPGLPSPLSVGELAELYRTNETVSREDEYILTDELPPADTITKPVDFVALCAERHDLDELDRAFRADLWNAPRLCATDLLDSALASAQEAAESIRRLPPWTARVVEAGSNPAERAIWDSLFIEVESVRADALSAQALILTHTPTLSAEIPADRAVEIYEAIAHDVKLTGKAPNAFVQLMRSQWKTAIEGASVGGGGKPKSPEHFQALAKLAYVASRRAALRRRWAAQVEPLGGPSAESLGIEPEVVAQRFSAQITAALSWPSESWLAIEGQFAAIGFDWSTVKAEADAAWPELDTAARIVRLISETLTPIFVAERARRRWQAVDDVLREMRATAKSWPASASARTILQAIDDLVPSMYREQYAEVERLRSITERARRREAFLSRLDKAAPTWAAAVRVRSGLHGRALPPGDLTAAWRWRQFENELNRRDLVSIPDLMRQLEDARKRLRGTTTELVDRKAWRAQVARTSLNERQALLGFAEAKRKIGRGTGKRAAQFAKAARDRMSDARSAVPVWIMPVVKAAEVFDPKNRFDVVIVDEASQSDVTGLLAFYLGKQIIVVGDDEQVSPLAVGEKLDETQYLIDEMLQGIPDAQLFDGKQSLYDIAKRSFGGTICLLEHFRCVPDIIQFSNELSYAGKIRPLREAEPGAPNPSVVEHRVASDPADGKKNEREARAVAALIAAANEQPEYDGMTFGVVSMVGDEQAYRIEEIIRSLMAPTAIDARRFLAGSAAQFQGDERNVMFLSLVDTGLGVPLRIRDTQLFRQRYNVAASRAQDQMWVVHSLDSATELQAKDFRRLLIEHSRDPGASERMKRAALEKAESPFEEAVIRRLADSGYRVITQHAVGAYRIDIVVEGANRKRLAVECDGDRYHTIDNLRDDAERQGILERLGWTFIRIRGSRFYRNSDAALQPVYERLATMGIEPHVDRDDVVPVCGEGLVERVRARAVQIESEIDEKAMSASAPGRKSWRTTRGAKTASASVDSL